MNSTIHDAEARELLLLRLYSDGIFGLDETRYWARELDLTPETQQRLMIRCVRVHFDLPDDLLAA